MVIMNMHPREWSKRTSCGVYYTKHANLCVIHSTALLKSPVLESYKIEKQVKVNELLRNIGVEAKYMLAVESSFHF